MIDNFLVSNCKTRPAESQTDESIQPRAFVHYLRISILLFSLVIILPGYHSNSHICMYMLIDYPILSLMIWHPLIAAALIGYLGHTKTQQSYFVALASIIISFLLNAYLYLAFDPTAPGMQLSETVDWHLAINSQYSLGLDGLGFV